MRSPHGHPWVAALQDTAMASLARLRPGLVSGATGRVLEVGVGTGANLPHYGAVDELWAVDPDPHMLRRARARADAAPFPVHLDAVDGEALPFDDASFDTVVATWVLCTIPDGERAVAEMHRVLRPGGRLLFAEHTISPFRVTRWLQHACDPVWTRLAGGCHLDRDPLAWLDAAGFVDVTPRPRGPQWSPTPIVTGTAARRAG